MEEPKKRQVLFVLYEGNWSSGFDSFDYLLLKNFGVEIGELTPTVTSRLSRVATNYLKYRAYVGTYVHEKIIRGAERWYNYNSKMQWRLVDGLYVSFIIILAARRDPP